MAYKIGMVSLGCPKNQVDAEIMLAKLKKEGYEITADSGTADLVIVNTCGFIEDAKRESIDNILEFAQLKKEGQIQKIIVTGCLAERYRRELAAEMPECDGVLGLGANNDIVETVLKIFDGAKEIRFPDKSCWKLDGERLLTTPSYYAYLRIGDGCDNRCNYCAIPLIRGDLQNRAMDSILEEAAALAQNGVRELILVAQDTTAYGVKETGKSQLPELLRRLCEIPKLYWIRLLYCYPQHITDEFLTVIREQDKIVKYLDIPLQHVSGHILAAMNRSGDAESLRHLILHIRKSVPGIVLRTTVMTGFPGETEDDFEELCNYIKEMKFERLGCFAFSPEEGTPASAFLDQLEPDEKNRRRDLIMELQSRIMDQYNRDRVGKTIEVLVEGYDRYAECWFGRSAADAPDIDCKVFFTTNKEVKTGNFAQVQIIDVMDWDLIGELV